jgi:hypothetical protein
MQLAILLDSWLYVLARATRVPKTAMSSAPRWPCRKRLLTSVMQKHARRKNAKRDGNNSKRDGNNAKRDGNLNMHFNRHVHVLQQAMLRWRDV